MPCRCSCNDFYQPSDGADERLSARGTICGICRNPGCYVFTLVYGANLVSQGSPRKHMKIRGCRILTLGPEPVAQGTSASRCTSHLHHAGHSCRQQSAIPIAARTAGRSTVRLEVLITSPRPLLLAKSRIRECYINGARVLWSRRLHLYQRWRPKIDKRKKLASQSSLRA